MSIVVTGYASLDYAVRLDRPPRPDPTATILSRPDEWPRLGGSPAYVAAALVEGGVRDAIADQLGRQTTRKARTTAQV